MILASGYDAPTVIDNTSDRLGLILVFAALAAIGGYMQYLGAMRIGARDRSYSIPLATNLWNVAHDVTFVASYDSWFDSKDEFWILKLFWVGLIVFTVFELVVISQIMRYAREDLFGAGCTLTKAIAIYLVLQAFVFGIFWWFQDITEDPLEYYGLMSTVLLSSAFNISMMRARGSRRGMSEFILWGYVVLSLGFWPWMMLSHEYFREPIFFLMAAGNIAVGLASIKVYRALPAWEQRLLPASGGTPARE